MDGRHIEPEIQVLPELLRLDELRQIVMRGGDDARLDGLAARGTYRRYDPLLHRRAHSGRGDIQHVDRIMTTLAPLTRQFVEEVVMLLPWERARRIAKLVSALSDIPSGEVH